MTISRKLKKELVDQPLHILQGVLVSMPVATFSPWWACALVGFIAAMYREREQNFPDEGWRWIIQGSLTGRWMDVTFLTLGALITGALL